MDEEQIIYKCHRCDKECSFCYICPITKKIWCYECESKFYCKGALLEPRDQDGAKQHEHIRFPNFKGEINSQLYKAAQLEQYREDNI